MWSPVGPRVQWNLSNVVTCGTAFPRRDWTGRQCIINIGTYAETWRIIILDLMKVTTLDR